MAEHPNPYGSLAAELEYLRTMRAQRVEAGGEFADAEHLAAIDARIAEIEAALA